MNRLNGISLNGDDKTTADRALSEDEKRARRIEKLSAELRAECELAIRDNRSRAFSAALDAMFNKPQGGFYVFATIVKLAEP
jgi:hypothetical protein